MFVAVTAMHICHWLDEYSRDDALALSLVNCLKL